MPKGLLQEKFQRTAPDPYEDGSNSWIGTNESFQRMRKVASQPTMHIRHERVGAGSDADFPSPVTNRLPPGMFIDNQDQADIRSMVSAKANLAGSSDESNSTNEKMLRDGFQYQPMLGTDDLYTNEHTEEFYGEAKGTDDAENKVTGFLERNNYLDRT